MAVLAKSNLENTSTGGYYQDSHGSRRRVHPKRKHVTSKNKLRGPRAGRIHNQRLLNHTIDCNTCLNADDGDFCGAYFELEQELIAARGRQ